MDYDVQYRPEKIAITVVFSMLAAVLVIAVGVPWCKSIMTTQKDRGYTRIDNPAAGTSPDTTSLMRA